MMPLGHNADQFRAADDTRRLTRPLPSTDLSQAMIERLLALVKTSFYDGRWPATRWLQEQRHILKVLTDPASWATQRGISIPLARYEAILREIIGGIRQHGAVATVKFFPVYFDHAVKQWFIHHGEELYEEQKSMRNALDLRFLKGLNPTPARQPDPMEALAAANRVLASGRRKTKGPQDADQLSLL